MCIGIIVMAPLGGRPIVLRWHGIFFNLQFYYKTHHIVISVIKVSHLTSESRILNIRPLMSHTDFNMRFSSVKCKQFFLKNMNTINT